jgi:glutaredoxin 3
METIASSPAAAQVVMYTRRACGFCSAAKRLLDGKGVIYVEHDVTAHPELRVEMIQRANGRHTFPQIFIGDTHVGGFVELSQWEHNGTLDKALKGTPEPA